MFKELSLRNFKNFRDATLELGPFTVLVGANASGKSNLRDAFRFLHGVGRGYDLGEILEGAYGEGGEHVWNEIRGGTANVAYGNVSDFELEARIGAAIDASYQISVRTNLDGGNQACVRGEQFHLLQDRKVAVFDAPSDGQVRIRGKDRHSGDAYSTRDLSRNRPILGQMAQSLADPHTDFGEAFHHSLRLGMALHRMRFLDFDPPALRVSSKVGQTTLGDRGQNLASVLMDICRDEQKKATIVDWLETLTPMDAQDIRFEVAEHSNEVTLILVEQDGTETPSYSASDGTLRFLGLLALLFQPSIVDGALVSMSLSDRRKPPRFLFLEEIETGLHPTRLALLANLIEQRTRQTDIQVVATTHSPQFLQVLDDDTLEDAQLVYRTGDGPEAKICPLLDVPDARKVLAKPNQSVGELHETGWFERVMAFSGGEGVPG